MKRLTWTIAVGAGLALAACRDHETVPANHSAETEAEAEGGNAATAGASEVPIARAAADPQLQWGPCPEGMPEGCGIAVLHGDPANPNADIFLRVPGGAAIPPHGHTSAERMVLVSGELEVKYQGAPPAMLRTGHYAYGPAKVPHQATCRSSEPCTLFIAFEEPVDVLPHEGAIQ